MLALRIKATPAKNLEPHRRQLGIAHRMLAIVGHFRGLKPDVLNRHYTLSRQNPVVSPIHGGATLQPRRG